MNYLNDLQVKVHELRECGSVSQQIIIDVSRLMIRGQGTLNNLQTMSAEIVKYFVRLIAFF